MNYNLEKDLIGFELLYESMNKCRKNVGWKDSVAHYYLNGIEETIRLEKQLKSGTYVPRKPKKVIVTYPKRRDVLSISFRDRVFQRSLNDNALYPIMTNSFIYDNMACQSGKGPDLARDRLHKFMRRQFINYGNTGHVLQCDIKGYFPSMPHDIVEQMFEDKLPKEINEMVQGVLHSQYEGDVGYFPGSQMIQIAGISLLNPMDHFIKEKLRIKDYMRYNDDYILLHQDKEYLKYCLEQIKVIVQENKLELNQKKTSIYNSSKGIDFLGFKHRITDTGKIIMTIEPEKVKHERIKLRKMVHKVKKGLMTKDKVDQCYECWKAHASKGNSYKLLQRMDAYYASLWREPL